MVSSVTDGLFWVLLIGRPLFDRVPQKGAEFAETLHLLSRVVPQP